MKNLFRKLGGMFLGLAMLSGVFVGASSFDKFANDIEAGTTSTLTLDKLGTSLSSTSNTTIATTNITASDSKTYTINYLQGKKQGDAILLTKSTGAFISNKTAMPGAIVSAKVYINSGASGKTTYYCAFNTSECTSAYTTGSTAVNITGGNNSTFTCSVSNAKYFCISLGNANNGQVLKVEITYSSLSVDSIAVTTNPSKTTYYVGDELDTTGLVVTATYSDSSTGDVTSDCTFSPTTLNTAGTQTIIVTHTASTKTATFDVTVNEQRTITGIQLHGSLTKTEYVEGQSYDITGLDIQVNWSVGDPSYVQFNDGEVTYILDPTVASLGDTSINLVAEYKDFEIDENLDVSVVPLSVSLSRKNGKDNFLTTSKFSFGGTITATWNDALVETIEENTDASTLRDTNGLSYRLYETSSSSSYTSIKIGDDMSIDYNEFYVGVVYHEMVANKYKIYVTEPVDFSNGAFYKVTEEPNDYSGSYILVTSPSASANYAFTGIDASTTGITSVTITNNIIEYNTNLGIVTFESSSNGYSIMIESGEKAKNYIGRNTNSNGMDYSQQTAFENTIGWEDAGTVKISGSAGPVFLFNNSSVGSGGQRFRYFKDKTSSTSGYFGIYLFKFVSNQNKAVEYATNFNNANVCGESDDTPAVASEWAKQKTAWSKLSSGAQSLLTKGTATGTTVHECLERYDTAVAKAIIRGTSSTIDNFMKRSVSASSPLVFSINNIDNNNNTLLVIIISLVSLTVIGGYFFYKKRKEN